MRRFKLVSTVTGQEIKVGDTVTTFQNKTGRLTMFGRGRKPKEEGRIYVRLEGKDWDDVLATSAIRAEVVLDTGEA